MADNRHVLIVRALKRVVADRQIGTRGIQKPQLMQAASAVHVRQQILEELQIAFTVKDHHWNAMGLIRRSDNTCEILGNDVAQQRCFAGAGHAQNDRLHDPHPVRPIPGLAVNVVAEHHRILIPCL